MMSKKVPELRFAGFADDWEQRKLGEITTSFSGGTPSAGNSSYYKGDIPFIRSGEINSDKTELFLTEAGLKNSSAKMVSVGDILYALYGATSGEVGISQINGAINQAILAIKPCDGYNSHFLMQWLKLQKQKIIDKYLQGGQGNLSGSIVKNLVLNVSSYEEQQKIGAFFKQLDDTIALYQRKLDLLKEQKKGFLQKMFPKNGAKVPELRFAGFADDWEERKLGEVATFLNGRAYKQDELLDSGKYKVLRVGNFYTNDSWYYSNMELDDKYYIDKGDLVYTWSATFGPHIWSGEKVIYHYHIWKVELSKFLDRNFTLQLLEADKERLLSSTNGSTMIHVTKGDMESKIVSIPNIDEQKQIGSFFKQLDDTIALHQRKLDLLKEQKKGFLQKMFV
ncbi:restriction endonuclease subunit S [Streptococcus thermophilus]|nr:restriction endonuclease subunit S [Streptococcus thermophilus]